MFDDVYLVYYTTHSGSMVVVDICMGDGNEFIKSGKEQAFYQRDKQQQHWDMISGVKENAEKLGVPISYLRNRIYQVAYCKGFTTNVNFNFEED